VPWSRARGLEVVRDGLVKAEFAAVEVLVEPMDQVADRIALRLVYESWVSIGLRNPRSIHLSGCQSAGVDRHDLTSSIAMRYTGPVGGRSRYWAYFATSAATAVAAVGSSAVWTRARPRMRTHQRFDQS
jgi:hypothetical protein